MEIETPAWAGAGPGSFRLHFAIDAVRASPHPTRTALPILPAVCPALPAGLPFQAVQFLFQALDLGLLLFF